MNPYYYQKPKKSNKTVGLIIIFIMFILVIIGLGTAYFYFNDSGSGGNGDSGSGGNGGNGDSGNGGNGDSGNGGSGGSGDSGSSLPKIEDLLKMNNVWKIPNVYFDRIKFGMDNNEYLRYSSKSSNGGNSKGNKMNYKKLSDHRAKLIPGDSVLKNSIVQVKSNNEIIRTLEGQSPVVYKLV